MSREWELERGCIPLWVNVQECNEISLFASVVVCLFGMADELWSLTYTQAPRDPASGPWLWGRHGHRGSTLLRRLLRIESDIDVQY